MFSVVASVDVDDGLKTIKKHGAGNVFMLRNISHSCQEPHHAPRPESPYQPSRRVRSHNRQTQPRLAISRLNPCLAVVVDVLGINGVPRAAFFKSWQLWYRRLSGSMTPGKAYFGCYIIERVEISEEMPRLPVFCSTATLGISRISGNAQKAWHL